MTLDIAVGMVIRVLLAFVFLRASWHKIGAPRRFLAQLEAYQLLPAPVLPAAAGALLVLEVALACCLPLASGSSSAFIAAALLMLYALAMGINLRKGRRALDCGCNGPSGTSQYISWGLVIRNCALAVLALAAALPHDARSLSLQDYSTILFASIAAVLIYSSIEQAIVNQQRQRLYLARSANAHEGISS